MRSTILKAWVVVSVLWLLVGCSAVRVAYDTGPTLAWWWIDGYGDFNGDQATRVKDDIRTWFDWHRKSQLSGYAAWLAATRAQLGESVTPAQMCRWWTEARRGLDPAIDRALLAAAGWVPTLTKAQLEHIERRYAKGQDDMRRDFLQTDLAERHQASVERTLERVDMVYGEVSEAQRKLVEEGVRASPFDPQAWANERRRRQRDTIATLRSLIAERAQSDRIVAALRALTERSERSPDPAYRAYQQRLTTYNCEFAARVHNAATPLQRKAARDRFKGWEDDLKALSAATAAP